jgi:hypothetical protein
LHLNVSGLINLGQAAHGEHRRGLSGAGWGRCGCKHPAMLPACPIPMLDRGQAINTPVASASTRPHPPTCHPNV